MTATQMESLLNSVYPLWGYSPSFGNKSSDAFARRRKVMHVALQ